MYTQTLKALRKHVFTGRTIRVAHARATAASTAAATTTTAAAAAGILLLHLGRPFASGMSWLTFDHVNHKKKVFAGRSVRLTHAATAARRSARELEAL